MTHRNVIRLFSGTMLAALVFGCGTDKLTNSGPFLQVDPLNTGVDEGGGTVQLTATVGGQPAAVTWESSNTAVATVSATGLVTGLVPGRAAATASLVSDASQKSSSSLTVVALTGIALANGVPVTGLSGTANGTTRLYRIAVPAGKTNLAVVLGGGTGDADIFVQRGTPPTSTSFICSSEGPTTTEACNMPNPAAGTWYILVVSFIYSGASLTATYTP